MMNGRTPLSQLPLIAGPRALLRTRTANLASASLTGPWLRVFSAARPRALLSLALCSVAVISVSFSRLDAKREVASAFSRSSLPDGPLTPGAARTIAIGEICSMAPEDVEQNVSPLVRQKVFREYGIPDHNPDDYEVDCLIAGELGGADDIRNLWPEPKRAIWNERVKDALEEERLHQLVCTGKLDLTTAQHDIATDWAAAYEKYFHTDKPYL